MKNADTNTTPNGPAGAPERYPVTLSAADAAIVDALLDHPETPLRLAGDQPHPAAGTLPDAARQARVQQLFAALGRLPEPPVPAGLHERTLRAARDDTLYLQGPQRNPMSDAAPEGGGLNLSRRLSQLGAVAVAASVLLAVLIPGIGQLRQKAYISTCTAHLQEMGSGLAGYAAAEAGVLPRLDNGDGNWLPHDPSARSGHSNTSNLLPLIQKGFVAASRLVCPGRGGLVVVDANTPEIAEDQCGYSYANLFGAVRARWDGRSSTIVLADRNPLFDPVPSDDAQDNSINHHRQGNNALAADGSVIFATHPNIGPQGDNIWTIAEGRSYHRGYKGTEVVQTADDVFLAP